MIKGMKQAKEVILQEFKSSLSEVIEERFCQNWIDGEATLPYWLIKKDFDPNKVFENYSLSNKQIEIIKENQIKLYNDHTNNLANAQLEEEIEALRICPWYIKQFAEFQLRKIEKFLKGGLYKPSDSPQIIYPVLQNQIYTHAVLFEKINKGEIEDNFDVHKLEFVDIKVLQNLQERYSEIINDKYPIANIKSNIGENLLLYFPDSQLF